GASWANVVQFTTYLVHSQDIPKFMAFRLREFPRMFPDGKYPPNTLLMVDRLVKGAVLVEAQAIAAVWPAVPHFGNARLARSCRRLSPNGPLPRRRLSLGLNNRGGIGYQGV